MTWLGKRLKNKLTQQLGGIVMEEQVNLVVQENSKDEPAAVTYSEADPPIRGNE